MADVDMKPVDEKKDEKPVEEEKKPMRSFGLLTDKPQVVILNAAQGTVVPDSLRAVAPEALAIDAKLELELLQMAPDEREAFMADFGIETFGRDRIIPDEFGVDLCEWS